MNDDLPNSIFQQIHIEMTPHFEQHRLIEVMGVEQALFKESVLNRRKRQRAGDVPLFSIYRRCRTGDSREFGNGLVLKQLPRSKPQPGLIRPSYDLYAQNRIASKVKEVIVNAYSRDAQHLRPDSGQQLFGWRARSDVVFRKLLRLLIGRWQSLAIHLA